MVPSVFLIIVSAYFTDAAFILEEWYSNEIDESIKNGLDCKEEQGGYFEGDMMLTTAQMEAIMLGNTRRNGLRNSTFRWPNATVVYHIEDYFNEIQVKMIKAAMDDISSKSCIKFRPRENDEHAVIIEDVENVCSSCVGYRIVPDRNCTKQRVNLSRKGCFTHGTIVHELLHTIGFFHMQSSYDRDDYVDIIWENIGNCTEINFWKYPKETVTNFGVPYDYDSVMHYGEYAFSKNGERTIIPRQENVTIGQREGLSKGDIIKLNRMYCEKYEE